MSSHRQNNHQNNSRTKGTETVKHSGASLHNSFVDKTTGEVIDSVFITAWNYSKSRGMLSIIATPRKDKAKRETKNPFYENWAVKVFNKRTLTTVWHNGFYDKRKQKLTIKDMEFVINPKAKRGGYCGTYVKK